MMIIFLIDKFPVKIAIWVSLIVDNLCIPFSIEWMFPFCHGGPKSWMTTESFSTTMVTTSMMLAAITRLGYLTYGSDGPFPEDLPTTVMFHSYVELREGPMTFHKSLSGFSKQNPSFFG